MDLLYSNVCFWSSAFLYFLKIKICCSEYSFLAWVLWYFENVLKFSPIQSCMLGLSSQWVLMRINSMVHHYEVWLKCKSLEKKTRQYTTYNGSSFVISSRVTKEIFLPLSIKGKREPFVSSWFWVSCHEPWCDVPIESPSVWPWQLNWSTGCKCVSEAAKFVWIAGLSRR